MSRIRSYLKVGRKYWNHVILPYLKDPLLLNKWVSTDLLSIPPDAVRKTVWVAYKYRSIFNRDDFGADLYMYIADMTQSILPSRSLTTSYKFNTAPLDDNLNNLLANALSDTNFRESLTTTCSKFITEAAQSLFYSGKAVYEVVLVKNDQNEITRLEIQQVYAPSVKKILGTYWQIIPWKSAKFARIKAGIRHVPKNNILYIEFPKKLGGLRAYKKVVKELVFMSKVIMPDFQIEAMKNQINTGFNFNEYIWQRYLFKGKISRAYGWNQRKSPDNDMLEYYSVYRHLKFAKSQVVIREHILARLNAKLKSEPLNFSSIIECENVLQEAQVDEEFSVLKAGNTEFGELWNRTSPY